MLTAADVLWLLALFDQLVVCSSVTIHCVRLGFL